MEVKDLHKYFQGKRVFVTGHTGFKGSWLTVWLHQLGAHIRGYALAPETNEDLYVAMQGDDLCESIIADIRDQETVCKAILEFEPDFVFHLAAQPLVLRSYQEPKYTHEVNVLGTANVLEALRMLNKPCVAVMITTDKVYLNDESGRAFKEDDPLGGYDPYSASKAAAEIIISSYRNSFFNPCKYQTHRKSISVARAGNVIGGGDWSKNRLVPDIINALVAGKPVVIRNPESVRPWQHVLDPLFGYLTLAAHKSNDPIVFADAFNFGPEVDDALRVKELVEISVRVWGTGEIEIQHSNHHEAGLLRLDITKSKERLHWYPRFTSQQAVVNTVNFYKAAVRKERIIDLIKSEINKF